MKAKDMIRQIIKEELENILKEQMHWHKPAEEEHSAYLNPSAVHEAGEKKKGVRIGKSNRTGKYTSAGTVPVVQGRKLTDDQIQHRKEIGDKMLNALRRGGPAAKKFRERLNAQLQDKKRGKPTDRLHQYSMIWANASSIAANGGTAADWDVSGEKQRQKKKEQRKQKKNNKQSGETQ